MTDGPDSLTITLILNGTEVECSELQTETDFRSKTIREEIDCAAVPIDDLEALADKWESDENGIIYNEAFARDQCAQELRSLLEDHQ